MNVLVTDFDWTLCPHEKPDQFQRNLVAIKHWRNNGNKLGIATGRNITSLATTFPEYASYTDYIFANDGAEGYEGNRKLFSVKIGRKTTDKIIECLNRLHFKRGVSIISYNDNVAIRGIGHEANKIRLWFEDIDDCAEAVSILGDELYYTARLLTFNEVKANFDTKEFSWVAPTMKHFVEIIAPKVNKGAAIDLTFGFKNHCNIITIGDDINDSEMIMNYDGYAVAGGNKDLLSQLEPTHIVDSLEALINQLLKSPAN